MYIATITTLYQINTLFLLDKFGVRVRKSRFYDRKF
jgi:hypothetical protein